MVPTSGGVPQIKPCMGMRTATSGADTVARTLVRKSIEVAVSHPENASRTPPIVQRVSRDRHFPFFFVTATGFDA